MTSKADTVLGHQIAHEVAERVARPKPKRSWWTDYADPTLPREQFTQAAKNHDREMQADPHWKSPAKLQQIGQL